MTFCYRHAVMMRFPLLTVIPILLANAVPAQTTRVVRLNALDNTGIIGTYYSTDRETSPAVVLVHGLGQTRHDWTNVVEILQKADIAALAIDLRGHGDSKRRLTANGPIELNLEKFTPRDYKDMLMDINVATDWLVAQGAPHRRRVGIVGAGLGANLALCYASLNEDLGAVALLSPTLVDHEIHTERALRTLGAQPLRIYVSRQDAFPFQSCQRLMQVRKELGRMGTDRELVICSGYLYGMNMLTGVNRLPEMIVAWLKVELLEAPRPPPAPSPAK